MGGGWLATLSSRLPWTPRPALHLPASLASVLPSELGSLSRWQPSCQGPNTLVLSPASAGHSKCALSWPRGLCPRPWMSLHDRGPGSTQAGGEHCPCKRGSWWCGGSGAGDTPPPAPGAAGAPAGLLRQGLAQGQLFLVDCGLGISWSGSLPQSRLPGKSRVKVESPRSAGGAVERVLAKPGP